MVEFYYWREGSGGKSRLECVVLFLPDVWSAQPSRVEWTTVQDHYKAACEAALKKLDGEDPQSGDAAKPAPAESHVATEKSKIVCSQLSLVLTSAACSTVRTKTTERDLPTTYSHAVWQIHYQIINVFVYPIFTT